MCWYTTAYVNISWLFVDENECFFEVDTACLLVYLSTHLWYKRLYQAFEN